METVITTGIAFATGLLVGLGLAWRHHEALRMSVRTAERKLDQFRRDDIQTWLDDIGPVTPPPGNPTAVAGLVLFDQDAPPDDPGPLTDPHYWTP